MFSTLTFGNACLGWASGSTMEGIKILVRAGRPRAWQKFSKVSGLVYLVSALVYLLHKVTVENIFFQEEKKIRAIASPRPCP